jgi:putative aminopeptidase FrvX
MDQKQRLALLKQISELDGISGHEVQVARFVKQQLTPHVDKVVIDNVGSVIGIKQGPSEGPTVMISAHMDEVGFLVHKIEKNGYLRIHPVGGWWGHVLLAQVMKVTTRDNKTYFGVIGARPPHGMTPEMRQKVIEVKDMFLDLGVSDKEKVEKLGIKVGDMVTPYNEFRVLNDGATLLGKAWDDRICVAAMIETMENVKSKKLKATIAAAATVQEEVGLRGAKTSSYLIKPDLAISIDVTMSYDLPGVPEHDTKLHAGVALSVMDAGVIAHRGLFDWVEQIAKDHDVKYTYDIMTAGRTDAGEIHKQYDGVITMTVSLPCRYFHSHVSLVSLSDYEQLVKLLTAIITTVDSSTIEQLKKSKFE